MDSADNIASHEFFSHTGCEYFPCHEGVDPAEFNCLFCYCPLYHLGQDCGGSPQFLNNGVKDCSDCTLPHRPSGYKIVADWLAKEVLAASTEATRNKEKK